MSFRTEREIFQGLLFMSLKISPVGRNDTLVGLNDIFVGRDDTFVGRNHTFKVLICAFG